MLLLATQKSARYAHVEPFQYDIFDKDMLMPCIAQPCCFPFHTLYQSWVRKGSDLFENNALNGNITKHASQQHHCYPHLSEDQTSGPQCPSYPAVPVPLVLPTGVVLGRQSPSFKQRQLPIWLPLILL